MGHTRQIHCAPSCHLPDFSRFFPVCVWILPFSIFPVPVVLLPLPLFVPFVLSALHSHHNSGAAVIKIFRPQRLNNGGTPKFHGLKRLRAVLCAPLSALGQPPQLHRVRLPRLHGALFVSLGGRWPARYCASNARRAAPTVEPIPTMPSSTFGPRRAIQRSPRKNSCGRRTADGLPGRSTQ